MPEHHPRSPPAIPTTDLSTLLGMRTKASRISKACKFLSLKFQANDHEKRSSIDKDEEAKGGGKKEKSRRNTNGDDDESATRGSSLESGCDKTADDKFVFRRSLLSRSGSRRSHAPTLSSYLSRSTSTRNENHSHVLFDILSRNKSSMRSVSTSRQSVYVDEGRAASIKRSMSCTRGSTNTNLIMFSQTMARKKSPAIEKKLECTLEELCFGGVKYVIIKRNILSETGGGITEDQSPGWKKGTKITFEGKGDEKPGHLPADIVFLIEEKWHPMFKRRGDNLEIGVEIPLVQALTGCSLSVPLLGGEKMNMYFNEVILPG